MTTPPTAPIVGGIGTAEARSSGRHYRHGRSARRWSSRLGSRAALVSHVPPRRDVAGPAALAEPLDGPDDSHLQRLRQALVQRAVLLAGPSAKPDPMPVDAAPGPAPKSVSFDFEAGLKTTLFEDGASVREPFDVTLARRLAAPPPAKAAPSS